MQLEMLRFRKAVVTGGIALLALAALSLPGEAGVKPGDFITPDNASQVKDLVSPGVLYKVRHGMTMKIVPTVRVDWPPPYKDATEKYSSQVQLSKDHRTVIGYVAGQPFPLIDANEPGRPRLSIFRLGDVSPGKKNPFLPSKIPGGGALRRLCPGRPNRGGAD